MIQLKNIKRKYIGTEISIKNLIIVNIMKILKIMSVTNYSFNILRHHNHETIKKLNYWIKLKIMIIKTNIINQINMESINIIIRIIIIIMIGITLRINNILFIRIINSNKNLILIGTIEKIVKYHQNTLMIKNNNQ